MAGVVGVIEETTTFPEIMTAVMIEGQTTLTRDEIIVIETALAIILRPTLAVAGAGVSVPVDAVVVARPLWEGQAERLSWMGFQQK